MGTWGTGIFQCDDAIDLRESFREKCILGIPEQDAEQEIIREFSVGGDFFLWTPLAITQWSLGRLSASTKANALREIRNELSGLDMLWSTKDVPKRRSVLLKAEAQLCSPQPARRKLHMPCWAWKCPWPVGSVLQFRIRHPRENNPLLDEYVLLQLFGIAETPPGKIPCEAINVGLYAWHSSLSPLGQLEYIRKAPPALTDYITPSGERRISHCILPTAEMRRENALRCICQTSFVPSVIPPITRNAPQNTAFQDLICRSLLLNADT